MTSGHEIMSNILRVLEFGSPEFWPVVQQAASDQWPLRLTHQEPPYIDLGRSTEIDLVDGTKAPDKCWFDTTPGGAGRLEEFPTVVCEVGWSQMSDSLALACGRWIAGSQAQTNLAVAIDIVMKHPEKELAQLWCNLWELEKAEPLANIPAGEYLNCVVRADGYWDDPEVVNNHPPPSKFTCISHFSNSPEQIKAIGPDCLANLQTSPSFVKYYASITERFQVCPSSILPCILSS